MNPKRTWIKNPTVVDKVIWWPYIDLLDHPRLPHPAAYEFHFRARDFTRMTSTMRDSVSEKLRRFSEKLRSR